MPACNFVVKLELCRTCVSVGLTVRATILKSFLNQLAYFGHILATLIVIVPNGFQPKMQH